MLNVKEIFEKGVTPVSGEDAGKKFAVESLKRDGSISVRGADGRYRTLNDGEYRIYVPPKTMFEKHFTPTWGNLKKACEESEVPDDTPLIVVDSDIWGWKLYRSPNEIYYKDGNICFE